VLIPAYICTAAVEPVEAFGGRVEFYEIRKDCIPDLADLEARIDDQTRAILAVHFFGFPCAIRDIRRICDKYGLFLIEDCAHVLQGQDGGQPLGTFGEVSVFSWRKFLPLYDGGGLVLNRWVHELTVDWQRERFLFTLRVAKNLLERALPTALASPLSALRLRRSFPSSFGTAANPTSVPLLHVNPDSKSFDQRMINCPISRLSRILLEHCLLERVIAKRRTNYCYLCRQLKGVQGVRPLIDNLPAGVCPWVYPIFFEDMPNGQFPLRKLGIPAVSWGGVRPPRIRSTEFPAADFLYENLVFLPLHQDLGTKELDLIIEAVKSVRARIEHSPSSS